MTDQPAPDQQVETPGQQAQPPQGFIELARFNGLVRKVEELTLANRDLNTQLAAKASEIEQLKGQLGVKDVEKQVAVGERDKRLTGALTENAALIEEMKVLRGLQLKVQVAKELNRPDLLKIADRIPAVEDPEILKGIMQDFASFADDAVQAREKQLLAGLTPALGHGSVGPAAPSTPEGWVEKINSLPLGFPERNRALDEYGDFLERHNNPQR